MIVPLKITMNVKKFLISFGICIILFFAFFTVVFPYSIFSLHKSFTFETPWGLSNGLTYNEILERFEENYKKDLDNWYESDVEGRNLVVLQTQYILDIFKQKWLLDDNVTKIDKEELQIARSKLQTAQSSMYDLLIRLDLTYDQKDYLRMLMLSLDHQMNEINVLLDHPFYTRTTLKRVFGNLEQSYTVLFSVYRSFYASSVQSPPNFSRN